MTANRDCYVMFLSKTSWLDNIFRHNPVYAGTVGMSMAGKYFQDAVNGKTHLSLEMKQEGEFWYGKELEKKIYDYFEIPTIEEEVEFVDRRSRRVDAVPLLHDTADGLPIKISHTYEFGNDKKVNERLRCSAAKIDEEYLYQYVFACQELGTNPLSNVIFQIRHAEKILDLHGLQISSTQALAISAALLYMQQFTGFDLSNNPIFDKGCVNSDSLRCVGIVNAISMNAHIKTVSLSRTRISREAACALGRVVSYHGTLTKLDLSSNDLRDQGIEELSKGICSSLSILHLNLSNTKCTFRGATALSNMFLKNKTLEHVNLSWNNFLSKGSAALLTSMASHPKLEEVHLEWNLLGHNGGVAFGKLLQATKSIKRIDVAHCAIPESATESICAGLASNSVLENLRLQFNPLKDGVARIKDTFFANPNWKDGQPSIRLDHCEFDAVHYAASVINATVPTGHYRFDLSNQSHRTELAKLIAFATHENGENWRNESLDGKRFSWPKGHVWVMPKQGIVELDFVHMTKTEDQVMPENIFKQLIAMLNKAVSSEGMRSICIFSLHVCLLKISSKHVMHVCLLFECVFSLYVCLLVFSR